MQVLQSREVCQIEANVLLTSVRSTDFNYYISSKPNSRTCNFGFGNRSGNDTHTTGPSPNRYTGSEIARDKRATTLGFSRDEAVFGSMINEIEKKSDLPPPGAYQTSNEKGRAYSLRMKLPGEIDSAIKKRVPGPGQYQAIEINPAGRYPISSFKNARCISFGTPQRPQTSETQRLGPGSCTIVLKKTTLPIWTAILVIEEYW